MAAANPIVWFPGRGVASIHRRKVDKQAAASARWRPYFATWDLAHAHMSAEADMRLKKARVELKSAERHAAKVTALQKPSTPVHAG